MVFFRFISWVLRACSNALVSAIPLVSQNVALRSLSRSNPSISSPAWSTERMYAFTFSLSMASDPTSPPTPPKQAQTSHAHGGSRCQDCFAIPASYGQLQKQGAPRCMSKILSNHLGQNQASLLERNRHWPIMRKSNLWAARKRSVWRPQQVTALLQDGHEEHLMSTENLFADFSGVEIYRKSWNISHFFFYQVQLNQEDCAQWEAEPSPWRAGSISSCRKRAAFAAKEVSTAGENNKMQTLQAGGKLQDKAFLSEL